MRQLRKVEGSSKRHVCGNSEAAEDAVLCAGRELDDPAARRTRGIESGLYGCGVVCHAVSDRAEVSHVDMVTELVRDGARRRTLGTLLE